jgi:hypothetical protein
MDWFGGTLNFLAQTISYISFGYMDICGSSFEHVYFVVVYDDNYDGQHVYFKM